MIYNARFSRYATVRRFGLKIFQNVFWIFFTAQRYHRTPGSFPVKRPLARSAIIADIFIFDNNRKRTQLNEKKK